MATPTRNGADVAEVRKALATLQFSVGRLRARCADSVGLKRLVSDVERVAEDLELLGELQPSPHRGDQLPRVELVQDAPYDPTVYEGADDEGLGGMRDTAQPRESTKSTARRPERR
jgi:hypothetical protein